MKEVEGKTAMDNRGKVTFVNDFDMTDVKRFYVVENWGGIVRAWHGHKKEAKYVYVASGSAKILLMDMDTGEVQERYLSADQPKVLYVPPGQYNGSQSLENGTKIFYFSTSTLDESVADDYRKEYADSDTR